MIALNCIAQHWGLCSFLHNLHVWKWNLIVLGLETLRRTCSEGSRVMFKQWDFQIRKSKRAWKCGQFGLVRTFVIKANGVNKIFQGTVTLTAWKLHHIRGRRHSGDPTQQYGIEAVRFCTCDYLYQRHSLYGITQPTKCGAQQKICVKFYPQHRLKRHTERNFVSPVNSSETTYLNFIRR